MSFGPAFQPCFQKTSPVVAAARYVFSIGVAIVERFRALMNLSETQNADATASESKRASIRIEQGTR